MQQGTKAGIRTIADTIIWLSKERMKDEHYQNINSSIHGTVLDISQHLMEFMRKQGKVKKI